MAAEDGYVQNFLLYKVGSLVAIMGTMWYFRQSIRYHTNQRLYAWAIEKISKRMNKGMKMEKTKVFQHMHDYKQKVNKALTVLEVGSGSAANLDFFPVNTKLVCLDPNPHFLGYIKKNLRKSETVVAAEIVQGYAEDMPLESERFDIVVCTLVLCTVSDPQKSLAEMKRVLKPGGHVIFLEHVAAKDGSWTLWFQRLVTPVHVAVADGCNPQRKSADYIKQAGFSSVNLEHFNARKMPFWLRPCILGTAVK